MADAKLSAVLERIKSTPELKVAVNNNRIEGILQQEVIVKSENGIQWVLRIPEYIRVKDE